MTKFHRHFFLFSSFFFARYIENTYFCSMNTPKNGIKPLGKPYGKRFVGGVGYHIWKGVYHALCSWRTETWEISYSSKNNSNDRYLWVCKYCASTSLVLFLIGMMLLLHIGVGSWLLVSTRWAISGPQGVERATGESPRFFCILGRNVNQSFILGTLFGDVV